MLAEDKWVSLKCQLNIFMWSIFYMIVSYVVLSFCHVQTLTYTACVCVHSVQQAFCPINRKLSSTLNILNYIWNETEWNEYIEMERRKKIANRLCSRNRCAVDDDDYIIEFSVIIQSTELWIELIACVNVCAVRIRMRIHHGHVANACVGSPLYIGYLSMEKLN